MKKIAFLLLPLLMFAKLNAADAELTFGTVNWEPYFGENLKDGGVTVAVTKAAFARVGYNAEIQFMDWNRAVGLTTAGKLDGLFGCYYSEEREDAMEISEPIGEVDIVLFSKKGANITFESLEDLKPYKIGTMRGQVYTAEFEQADFLTKEVVDKFEQNVKKLLGGRIDLIVESRAVLQDVLNKKFPNDLDKIEVLSPALESNAMYIGFSKKVEGYEQILNDFNKGLKMIKEDGTYDEITKLYGF